ncbi:MAG TPA: helix-turn-helix transcriptional regulator [Actinopolymorphaceae bacterium]|jgi:transcriptional regulator with XRE-family HTH domain
MILLRRQLGEVLRRHRLRQSLTLRELSTRARVSLGYLSEIERGQKEASSELLTSICTALDVPLSSVLLAVSDELALVELADSGVTVSPVSRGGGAMVSSIGGSKVSVNAA